MAKTHPLDFALQELARLELDPKLTDASGVELCNLQMELRFLKMFICCYENTDCAGMKEVDLGSFMFDMEVASKEIASEHENWDILSRQLLEKVEHFKKEIKEICLEWLNSSVLQCKSSTSDEIYDFIVGVYRNLQDLVSLKATKIAPLKKQIAALQEKLELFGDLAKFTAERCTCDDEELRDFRIQLQAWANKVASLSFLYWVDQLEEETLLRLDTIYLDILQQLKPSSPEAIRMFLRVLKASKPSRSDTFLMGALVAGSVDMLIEDPMASAEDSSKVALRDGLIILITYLMDPPVECGKDGNEIWKKVDLVVNEAASLISSLSDSQMKEDTPNYERRFIEKINILKEEIRENYVRIQALSWSDFPRTNGLGFVDFLMGNLKERTSSIPFAKYLILAMQEKLISIRPYLKDLSEQQNQSEKLKDLWMQIIKVAYAVEHVVDSCFFEDNKIWYMMICLSIVLEEIEFVISKSQKNRHGSACKSRVLALEMDSSHAIHKHAKTSIIDEAVVGFKTEAKEIIDQLTSTSEQLQIVAIVGMPGQGKTTLAKKVYNDPSVKYHFHKFAWCFVSQFYQRKDLLLEILSSITALDDKVRNMKEEELAENLYRRLKGQRYLIVIDDIWDIEVWHQLKESFPNDNNRSRIVFTSRIHSIASQAKIGSNTHLLRPLSTDESWELLQQKIFNGDGFPLGVSEVGLQIAKICEGLPLSIVAIAGVLARRVKDLNWWKEIAENLSSNILGEGCMNILELSYKHLPDLLKPCFLYFGGFHQGEVVNVQKLTQLWVAEGFIPRIGTERPEGVATDFLMDLIGRSLVIVVRRSSNAGIKECRIHDLLFDFCLAKLEQERFLRPLKDSQYPPDMQYKEYRFSIHTEWRPFVESNPTALYSRSLLLFHRGNWNESEDNSVFMKFKFLRVLNLEYGILFPEFPEEIISLIHLRYLAIRGMSSLPENIENLQNLEVLCVHSSVTIIMVPATVWRMKRLRHICLRRATYFSFENSMLVGARLDSVETLSWPLLCHNEYGEELLRRFPKLRKLRFRLWGAETNCPQFPILDTLSNLESLNVLCPMGVRRPFSFRFPLTLKKLTVSESGIPWSEISAIGKLPNLEVLKLLGDAFVGERWDMEDEEFLNLKFLKLQCSNLQQWNPCTDPFPMLQCLLLEECYELDEIPISFGEISTLNLIEVRSCSNGAESSATEILIQQQDIGNDGFELLITSSSILFDDDDDV